MARQRIRIRRTGTFGPGKAVNARLADVLVRGGKFEYAEDLEATASPYEAMPYNDLRKLVKERGIVPDGTKRDDLIQALEGRYLRRDMRAED